MTPAWVDRAEYPFAVRRLTVDDVTMSYVDEGDGPTVLFLETPRRTP